MLEVGQQTAADGRPDKVHPGPGVLVYVESEYADEDVERCWDFAWRGDCSAELLRFELRFQTDVGEYARPDVSRPVSADQRAAAEGAVKGRLCEAKIGFIDAEVLQNELNELSG